MNLILKNHQNNYLILTLSSLIIIIIILIQIIIPSINAIHCWQCNSLIDKFCEDVPLDINNLHDCYKKMYRECIDDNNNNNNNEIKTNYTFCRKQVQTINEKTRIIRSCGSIRSSQECYSTKNHPSTTLVCQCDGDGCNSAMINNQSIFLLLIILLINIYYFIIY